jgi:two-component system phosphate regulon response regulator PhoB
MYSDKQIHIVEDDEDIRYIVAYILTDIGYKVKVSETVNDFNTQIRRYKPQLLLIDVMLPDGNGLELSLNLKNDPETAHIPIIIMSAHATASYVIQKSRAEDFISKPFDLDDLVTLVKKHLPLP